MQSASDVIASIKGHLQRVEGATAKELCALTGLSQSRLARVLQMIRAELLVAGRARSVRYYLRRGIPQLVNPFPIYRVDEEGKIQVGGTLTSAWPQGFYWQPAEAGSRARWFPDLPFFLNDLRPAGFMGRLVPALYPEWEFPADIRVWSGSDCLRYLYHLAPDAFGNLIVGDVCLQRLLEERVAPCAVVGREEAGRDYDACAARMLTFGIPGSSTAGEQPKFVARRASDGRGVLVKFIARDGSTAAARREDLLIAEHCALCTYYSDGSAPYSGSIIKTEHYSFLELERFDRTRGGRRGIISLGSLDAEFGGGGSDWKTIADGLLKNGIISQNDRNEIYRRAYFGACIGNNDMHPWNCALFYDLIETRGVAPLYDMLPMSYMPNPAGLPSPEISPPAPLPAELAHWDWAIQKAQLFWKTLSGHGEVSRGFKDIAAANLRRIDESLVRRVRL